MTSTLPVHKTKAPTRRILLSLSWYSGSIHRGIARYARTAGWSLDLSTVHDSLLPLHWDGDGILCTAGNSAALDRRLLSYRRPIVNIGNDDTFPAPRVAADLDKVVNLAIQHFIERGFKHFAYYVCLGNRAEMAKLQVFKRAIAAAGKTLGVIDCSSCSPSARWRRLTRQLLRMPKPLAAHAQTDEFALELIYSAVDAGLRVPEDVAVLGCADDQLICPFAPVPLSSIDNNLEGIGYHAAKALDRLIDREELSSHLILVAPRGITTRQSTDVLAIANRDVVAAMHIIRDRYREQLKAKDIARELHVSYRTIHDAFNRLVGHSMAKEITFRRVEHAAGLLVHSRNKLLKVAWESGFPDMSRLVKVFRRVKGMTPGAYRRKFGRSG